VEKVETALLEKIGRDLLKERQTKPDHEADLFRFKQLRISAGIIPRPNVRHFADCADPLVVAGLRVNLREVTYAAVDVSSGRLVGWGAVPLFENVNSPVHYHHHALDKTVRTIGEAQNSSVLRIHDTLGLIRIRIRRSMPLTNGSGSGSWIRILLFSSLTFKVPAKT
jgi:hypothetical protein